MAVSLKEILLVTKRNVEERKRKITRESLNTSRQPHNFSEAFKNKLNIIAEVKLASPSEGDIFPSADPVEVAREYLSAGAGALSVLTEEKFFKGSYENLKRIRQAFPQAYLLMKDFIIDSYQIAEAKFYGADAILLIAAALDDEALKGLSNKARESGLSVLFEVHNESELNRIASVGASLIGINNRNLETMRVDIDTSMKMSKLMKSNVTYISESGIDSAEQIKALSKVGYKGFLIGTSFMKSQKPGEKLRHLLEALR